jgi:alanyl-tRNA synthetase
MMTSQQILEKFISFYTERGHKLIPNVSLVPENDPTLLFVNSGMFPLVPYLSGHPHPQGKRLMNVQRSLRLEDIEEIGDRTHTVAFHMIGNWSLGDYFKKEQLFWAYEFLIDELGLDPQRLYATVFSGNDLVEKDEEAVSILKEVFSKYGIEAEEGKRIFLPEASENWWKRGDAVGELGGPDSEVFYYMGEGPVGAKTPITHEDDFLEIGNSVFMQYVKTETGWDELTQKNVDFGGGLERIALAVQDKSDIFETDNFWPVIQKVEEISGKKYGEDENVTRSMRILADHMRASVFLAMDGVMPSNKDQGYILRRLLRRMTRAGRILGVERDLSVSLVSVVVDTFSWLYPDLPEKKAEIETLVSQEEAKFGNTLEKGARELNKMSDELILEAGSGNWAALVKRAFDMYQSLGYPVEIFMEDLRDRGIDVGDANFRADFDALFKQHREGSRAGAEHKFKGGLADHGEEVVKYHTATHLLHWALREVLGGDVAQQGSNITGERLRFDFNFDRKLTAEELQQIAGLVNFSIEKGLPVKCETLPKNEAEKTGAIHAFGEKYGDMVTVYYVGDDLSTAQSKEFCGGPHVTNTSKLKPLEIYKQDSIGKGKMRVYARFV